jgi:hypothetical protein
VSKAKNSPKWAVDRKQNTTSGFVSGYLRHRAVFLAICGVGSCTPLERGAPQCFDRASVESSHEAKGSQCRSRASEPPARSPARNVFSIAICSVPWIWPSPAPPSVPPRPSSRHLSRCASYSAKSAAPARPGRSLQPRNRPRCTRKSLFWPVHAPASRTVHVRSGTSPHAAMSSLTIVLFAPRAVRSSAHRVYR